jgi:sugar O-acyltransferase (sialic acid O-acetyltransferase NeuD family)
MAASWSGASACITSCQIGKVECDGRAIRQRVLSPMTVATTGPLAIFGGRGAGVLAASTFRRSASCAAPILGFLNDTEARGTIIEGITVLGSFASWTELPSQTRFIAPLHKAKEMRHRVQRIEGLGVPMDRWANIVDSTAVVADGVLTGTGIWAQAGAMAMEGARIGSHVALRAGCHVSHDCTISDYVSIGISAILCGYGTVERGAYIAPGAIIRDRVKVGSFSVVGLGAVVVEDVPPGAIVAGNPARVISKLMAD